MFKISPSDFAYLYEECKLCYCLKVKDNVYQPSKPMPGIFSAINSKVQGSLVGKNLQSLSSDLPDGIVEKQEGFVESIPVPGTNLFIKGKYDLLVKNPDGTYTIVDLKLSQADESKIEKYKSQLGAYKFALENPTKSEPIKISRTALLIFYPESVEFVDKTLKVHFPPKWLDIPLDDHAFLSFMTEIDELLSGPTPEEGETCEWCKYRHLGESFAHNHQSNEEPF